MTAELLSPQEIEVKREEMFKKLEERGTSQNTIQAMRQIPREIFAPKEEKENVFDFEPIHLESDGPSSVSAPHVIADMVDMLQVRPEDTVFELGTATGYQAAVLSKLANHVTTAEIDEKLADQATANFSKLGIENITQIKADGTDESHTSKKYSRLIISAAIFPSLENGFFDLLEEGGVCVVPVGGRFGVENYCMLTKIRKVNGELIIEDQKPDYSFVPLQGKYGWETHYRSYAFFEHAGFFGLTPEEAIAQSQAFFEDKLSEREEFSEI